MFAVRVAAVVSIVPMLLAVVTPQPVEADDSSEQISIEAFRARNAAYPDALSGWALNRKSVQNLYLKGDDPKKTWPVWSQLLYPSYIQAVAEDGDFVYFLMLNPVADVGTISKWKRVGDRLRYVSFLVATSEYLRGRPILGEPPRPLWQQQLIAGKPLNVAVDAAGTAQMAYLRLNTPEQMEAAIRDLSRPSYLKRDSDKPKMTDRDVAFVRLATAASRLGTALKTAAKKAELDDLSACISGARNSLCPPPVAVVPGVKGHKRKTKPTTLAEPTFAGKIEGFQPFIPFGFQRTAQGDIVFMGSPNEPALVEVDVIRDHKIQVAMKTDLNQYCTTAIQVARDRK